jgi:hypothetical protein
MHVELVGQDLKPHLLIRWPFRFQHSRLSGNSLRCGPSAGIPRTECFEGDAQRLRELRLGEAESYPDFPQGRSALGHWSRHCHRSAFDWKRMDGDENPRFVTA